jgi:hypothetical protein
MGGHTATDEQIRNVIKSTPISTIDHLIGEYIHDARNREIARRVLVDGEHYEPLSESVRLTPGQIKNIIRKARRTIFEHIE